MILQGGFEMKSNKTLWVITAIIGIVAMAAGGAVLIKKYLGDRKTCTEYIECDCTEEE